MSQLVTESFRSTPPQPKYPNRVKNAGEKSLMGFLQFVGGLPLGIFSPT